MKSEIISVVIDVYKEASETNTATHYTSVAPEVRLCRGFNQFLLWSQVMQELLESDSAVYHYFVGRQVPRHIVYKSFTVLLRE